MIFINVFRGPVHKIVSFFLKIIIKLIVFINDLKQNEIDVLYSMKELLLRNLLI